MSAAVPKKTPAEKRKETLAAKAEQERQAQVAFVAKSKNGRDAKVKAQTNAIWKADLPATTRKRTSTVQASETVKKARPAKEIAEPVGKDIPEAPVASKAKVAGHPARKYAPIPIEDSDDSAAESKKSAKSAVTKVKATTKKTVVTKAPPARITKAPHARVVAESASEEEAVSSEEHSDELSDEEGAQDVAPNEEEFHNEVPHVVSKSKVARHAADGDDVEMKDAKGKGRAVEELFGSDNESIEIDKPRNFKPRVRDEPDSDDSLPGAPRRVVMISDDDAEAAGGARVPGRSFQSRRSSTASWSSGQDLRVPNSDAEDEDVGEAPVPSKKPKSAYRSEYDRDMELHEAIAKGLTGISRRGSTGSRMSESDADDSMAEDEDAPVAPKKKARKISAARQKKAEMERPEVRPAPAAPVKQSRGLTDQLDRIAAATVDAASRPEDQWHISARIMFPAPGKDIGLSGQTEELKAVLRGCIEFIKLSLLFEDAYPAVISRTGYARSYLLRAAEERLPQAYHIQQRLENDLGFAARLADIPLDRTNILRGDFKRFACQDAPDLLKFAHLPPAEGRLMVELPFHNGSLISLLKKAVFTAQFKAKNLHLFVSTSANHPERLELPDAMVCLGATALYGSLVEYRATGKRQHIPFTEGAYEDVYRNHMKTLSDTRASAPTALRRVMHDLYTLVTETTASAPTATGSSSVLINLVEVDESD
ncbi:hypothetical protein DFH06DRAFT_1333704 [Mycena polygramma]|nr:hypothetical protein DFH06DRAFT_1333704 [Mycena polygramma]